MEINPSRNKQILIRVNRGDLTYATTDDAERGSFGPKRVCYSQFLMPSQKPLFTVMFVLLIQTRGA